MSAAVSREGVVRRFKRYPEYKDSGVEWLGRIPAHWTSKRMKYVAPIADERANESTADVPFVALEHIESGTARFIEGSAVQAEGVSAVFRPGDVLFGKLRPYLAKVFRQSSYGTCST